MRHFYAIAFLLLVLCVGCEWQLKKKSEPAGREQVSIERYDRIESLFLTTGDYGALQQLNTRYSAQTMMLVEEVLELGRLDSPSISDRFYAFYQDSVLQALLKDVQVQYDNMDDVDEELREAFGRLKQYFPHLQLPKVYAQVSALNQSIVVGKGMLAVSLDKYLGEDYPLYLRYGYSEQQRRMMKREFIVPDCVAFFLLSVFPVDGIADLRPRLFYVVNEVVGRKVFDDEQVRSVEKYMDIHKDYPLERLLTDTVHIIVHII